MNTATLTALEITGIGLAGVFIFMTVFYFVIIGIDKLFPFEEEKPPVNSVASHIDEDDDVES